MSYAFGKCYDPNGARHGIPTFPWKYAPDGYATRRQLRARGLRPGGQPVAAQLMRSSRRRKAGVAVAYLYRIDRAKPVRPMTPGRAARSRKRCSRAVPAPTAARMPGTASRPRWACASPAPTPPDQRTA